MAKSQALSLQARGEVLCVLGDGCPGGLVGTLGG